MSASEPTDPEPSEIRQPSLMDGTDLAALLEELARRLASSEAAEVERDMAARHGMEKVLEIEQRLHRAETAAARREIAPFRAALSDAYVRSGGDERREVPYDDSLPDQSAAAELLIRYLVRTGFAEVATDEPRPGRYVYRLRVFWSRLRQLAAERGIPFTLSTPPSAS